MLNIGFELTAPTCTTIVADPAVVNSDAGIVALMPVSVGVPLIVRFCVFAPLVQRTVGLPPEVNPDPLIVISKFGASANSTAGEMNLTEGAGAEMMKFESVENALPLRTRANAVPATVNNDAGIVTSRLLLSTLPNGVRSV